MAVNIPELWMTEKVNTIKRNGWVCNQNQEEENK